MLYVRSIVKSKLRNSVNLGGGGGNCIWQQAVVTGTLLYILYFCLVCNQNSYLWIEGEREVCVWGGGVIIARGLN